MLVGGGGEGLEGWDKMLLTADKLNKWQIFQGPNLICVFEVILHFSNVQISLVYRGNYVKDPLNITHKNVRV